MHATITGLALATAFASMAVVFVLKTFADAVFLSAFGVQYLPHFYVVLAVVMIGGSALYGKMLRRRTVIALDASVLVALTAACVAARLLVDRGGAWVFAIAVAMYALPIITSLALWNAATGAVSGRRARTFLAQAGAAATLGAVLGGFASSGLVTVASVDALAIFGAALAIAALALRLALYRRAGALRPEAPTPPKRARRPRVSARRLVALLAAAAVVEAVMTDVLDFGFKRAATEAVANDDLAMFFALFYGASNAVILALQLLATARVLATRALRYTLSVEPLALIAIAIGWMLFPGLLLGAVGRATESVLKFAVGRPAQEIALTPLRPINRQRWKVLIRGVFSKGGGVLAGLLLLALAPVLAAHDVVVPALVAALAAAWLLLLRGVAREYLAGLGSALGLRRLDVRPGSASSIAFDREGIARVIGLIADPSPQLAGFAREVLASAEVDASHLASHLGAGNPGVRRRLYDLMAMRPAAAARERLEAAVAAESAADHPETLAAGLRALAAHGSAAGADRARALAGDTAPADAVGHALDGWAYLAEVGALDDAPGGALEDVMAAVLAADGARAALLYRRAIDRDRIGAAEADNTIANAIAHGDDEVRAQGMCAAAALGRFTPLSKLLRALRDGAPGADQAFAHLDGPALYRLVGIVTSRDTSPDQRARFLRALRACDLPEVADVATTFLTDDDPEVREMAARLLLKQRRERDADVDRARVEQALALELDSFERYARARLGYAVSLRESVVVLDDRRTESFDATRDSLFYDEVERRTERELGRLCNLLALLGNPEAVYASERALRSPEFKQRRQAIDVLQEVARGRQRRRLLELLELYLTPPRRQSAEARAAVCQADPWLARCDGGDVDALAQRLALLRRTTLFADVDGEALVDLAAQAAERDVSEGDPVVRAGEPGDALYIVIGGRVRVEIDDKPLARLGPGDSFGELALFDGEVRRATVRAVKPTRVLELPRDAFTQALQTHRSIGLGLVRGLARWLRAATLPAGASQTLRFSSTLVDTRL